MNFLRDPLIQFAITTVISLISAIAAIRAIPKKERQQNTQDTSGPQPTRVRTTRGCILGSLALLATTIGAAYLAILLVTAIQTRIFPDPAILIIICSVGLIFILLFIALTLSRLVRGELQPPQLIQEPHQPIHRQGQEGSGHP